eukprot:TRINITY_DN751_c0_g3_i1.p1 TRINITY_DN751_c0_g3~~TRINITY_DN751_c0_g3_i1.p1  ORF type:complete len:1380 (+),score=239.93 TRINITY_DN751_c0_g3_i1:79-4218(+)
MRLVLLATLFCLGATSSWDGANQFMKGVDIYIPELELNTNKTEIKLSDVHITDVSTGGIDLQYDTKEKEIKVSLVITDTTLNLDSIVTFEAENSTEESSKPTSGKISLDISIAKLDVSFSLGLDDSSVPTSISGFLATGTNTITTTCACPCSDAVVWFVECEAVSKYLSGSSSLPALIETVLILNKKKITSRLANIATVLESFKREVPNPPSSEHWEPQYETYLNLNTSANRNLGMVLNQVYGVPGTGPNAHRLVINEVLEKLGTDRLLSHLGVEIPGVALGSQQGIKINVTDVGSITDFDPLRIVGNHTIRTRVGFVDLSLEVKVPVALFNQTPPHVIEITTVLDGVGLSVDLLLALGVDTNLLNSIELGSFFENWETLAQCLAYPVDKIQLKYLKTAFKASKFSVQSAVKSPTGIPTTGGVNTLIQQLFGLFSTMYGEIVKETAPYAIYVVGPTLINDILKKTVVNTTSCHPPSLHNGIVNFARSDLIKGIDFIAHDILGDIPSDMSLNKVVGVLLSEPNAIELGNGSVIVNAPIISTPQNVDMGYLQLTTKDGWLRGLQTFSEVKILQSSTENDYLLSTELVLENVSLSSDISLLWDNVGDDIADVFHLSLEMNNVTLQLDLIIQFEKKAFEVLHTNQLSAPCLFSAMSPESGMRIPVSKLTTDYASMSASCYSCSYGTIDAWGKKLETEEADEAVKNTLNNITNYLLQTFQTEKANMQLDLQQRNGKDQCTAPTPAPQATTDSPGTMGVAVLLIEVPGLSSLIVIIVLSLSAKRARDALKASKDLETAPLNDQQAAGSDDDDDAETVISTSPSIYETNWYNILRFNESICGHDVTSKTMKTAIPLTIAGLFILLLSSMLYHKAITIASVLWVAGQEKHISAYDYTTFKFTRDGFNAGGVIRYLAMAFGLISGCWSFIKLLAMFYLFYVPPTILSHRTRTSCIEWLDFSAKWSLLDLFVILFLCTVVDCNIAFPSDWPAWEDRLFENDLVVDTWFGLHGFVLTHVGGLIIGQLLLFKNRDVIASVRANFNAAVASRRAGRSPESSVSQFSKASVATTTWLEDGAEDTRREALRVHYYPARNTIVGKIFLSEFGQCPSTVVAKGEDPSQGKHRSQINFFGRLLVILGLLLCISLVITGCVLPFIGVHNIGFITPAINISPGESSKRSWAFGGLAKQFIDIVGTSSGQKVIHYILFSFGMVTVVLFPLLQFVLLVAVWVVPLTLKEHKKLFFLTECLASWSCLEVFVLALGLITLMMKDLMKFVIGDKFDGVNPMLHSLVNWGTSDMPPTAVQAEGDWCIGFWFLLSGCILFNAAYLILHKTNKAAIRDRERAAALNLETNSKRTYEESYSSDSHQDLDDADVVVKHPVTPPPEDKPE